MFDRMACSAARREYHPQVEISTLADLRALLAEVTGAGRVDPQISSTDPVLSADLMSCDWNQGDVHVPSSHKGSPVRAVRSVGLSQGDDDAGMAGPAGTDAPEDHRTDSAIAGGTQPGATDRARRRQSGPCGGEQ